MPIRFKYDPGAVGGLAAYAVGRGRAQERAADQGLVILERQRERQFKYLQQLGQQEERRTAATTRFERQRGLQLGRQAHQAQMAGTAAQARAAEVGRREKRAEREARVAGLSPIPEHLATTDPYLHRRLTEQRAHIERMATGGELDFDAPDGSAQARLDEEIESYENVIGNVPAPDPMAGALVWDDAGGTYRPVQPGEKPTHWSQGPGQEPKMDEAHKRQLDEAKQARKDAENRLRGLEDKLNQAESESVPNEKRVGWLKEQIEKEQKALEALPQPGEPTEPPARPRVAVDESGKATLTPPPAQQARPALPPPAAPPPTLVPLPEPKAHADESDQPVEITLTPTGPSPLDEQRRRHRLKVQARRGNRQARQELTELGESW